MIMPLISTAVVWICCVSGTTIVCIASVDYCHLDPKLLPCGMSSSAEAIRTTVVPISGVIRTTVVPISGVIGPTVVRIANATGIGYRHDGSIRFSYKLTNALNY